MNAQVSKFRLLLFYAFSRQLRVSNYDIYWTHQNARYKSSLMGEYETLQQVLMKRQDSILYLAFNRILDPNYSKTTLGSVAPLTLKRSCFSQMTLLYIFLNLCFISQSLLKTKSQQ